MVGEGDGLEHFAAVGFPVGGTEDVVDAHVDAVAIEGTAYAVGGSAVGVGEAVADDVVGIGDRGVVEVAHKDDAFAGMGVEPGGEGVGHKGALTCGVGNLLHNGAFAFDLFHLVGFLEHLVEIATVLGGESHALQVGADDADGVARGGTHGEDCHSVGGGVADEAVVDDGEARSDGEGVWPLKAIWYS